MKVEVCDVCRKEKDLSKQYGFDVCIECGLILHSMWEEINNQVKESYSEPQRHLAAVVNWIKSSDRTKIAEYFGTTGLKMFDKLVKEQKQIKEQGYGNNS